MSAPEIINPPGGGGGGGTVTGTGTPDKLAKFVTASSIGDSLLSESVTTITSAATAETFTNAQTWTVGAPNSQALVVLSNAGLERTLVLDTISRAVGVGVPTTPATLLHVSDGVTAFAGTTGAGVRLDRATEALFSSSDGTRSLRAGLTGGTAVVGTSTATDLLLQRSNVTAATLTSGAIATLTLTSPGAGYTNGTYSQQPLTGGTGTGATADFVLAGGTITVMTLRSPGTGYTAADALSCATLGAGAGLVVTVATISQVVEGSGNVAAVGRIGAGTATPRVTGDFVGSVWSRKSESILGLNQSGTYTQFRAGILVNPDAEPTKQTVVTATENPILCSIGAVGRYDLSARTTNTSVYGVYGNSSITTQNASASGFAYGGIFLSVSVSPTLSGASLNNVGVWAQAVVTNTVTSANTITTLYAYDATVSCSAVAAQSIPNAGYLVFRPASFSGAAHVVNDFYGLFLPTTTLSGGSTITNRWGIFQQDALAKNYFAGNTGIGTTTPATTLEAYSTATGEVRASSDVFSVVSSYTFNNASAAFAPSIKLSRARGTRAVPVAVNALDTIGTIGWNAQGTTDHQIANIKCTAPANAGADAISSQLTFATSLTSDVLPVVRMTIDPSGNTSIANNLAFNSGYGSATTVYGCRLWINWNNVGVIAIRASGGVSSITDLAVGATTVNFSFTMPDLNFCLSGIRQTLTNYPAYYDSFTNVYPPATPTALRTTTSVVMIGFDSGGAVDSPNCSLAIFR